MALEKVMEKGERAFKSEKVQKIWGSALKYLPELLEELKRINIENKNGNQ